jgi:hypothetical protein
MDADTFKAVLETVERLAYRAGAAEAERHAVEMGPPDLTTPAAAPAEHPTLARLRKAVQMSINDVLHDTSVAVYGTEFGDNVLWGELRAWAKEGGKA